MTSTKLKTVAGLVVAAAAGSAFAVSGATAAHGINGRAIRNHSIPLVKLTYGAQKILRKGKAGAIGRAGPAGPQGQAGPRGPAGPQGPAGPSGPAGKQGSAGSPGITGAMGPAGPPGRTGLAGPPGKQGVPGPPGAAGPRGASGRPAVAVYAHVAKDGQVLADSKNLGQSNLSKLATGTYCMHRIVPSLDNAVVSVAWGTGATSAVVRGATSSCRFTIYTLNKKGARVDSPFFVQVM